MRAEINVAPVNDRSWRQASRLSLWQIGFFGQRLSRMAGSECMKRMVVGPVACFILVWIVPSNAVLADDVETQIRTILKVEKEGAGHAAAVPVLKSLAQQPTTALIPLLRGMDQANPLAANWLRGAFEAIADRNLKDGAPLPKEELEEFALDRAHAPQSRQLAFDWLVRDRSERHGSAGSGNAR